MERIGTYLVERKLGEGGMGTVHLARSRGGRAVAVKVARPELAADPMFRERFRAEVEAARKVGGFHTAPVVDADTEADPPWLATAYIPGPTLTGLVDRQGPMDESGLRRLGAALAEALQAVHACGLVHRDLKPGNIIMAEDGPRVLDFGIARAVESTRLTATGAAFGTPGYLAPEQALGQEATGATDIFALGAVLVAAAGGRAFGEGTPMGLMYRSVHEAPDLGAVPTGLREVVAACLAKTPGDRPTPEALLDLLLPAGYEPTVRVTPGPEPAEPLGTAPRVGPAPQYPPAVGSQYARSQGSPAPQQTPGARPVSAGAQGDSAPQHAPGTRTFVARRNGAGPNGATRPKTAAAAAAPQDAGPRLAAGSRARAETPLVFVAADSNSSVAIDAEGVILAAPEHETEFTWDEIGAVQYTTAGRGNRLKVTVMLYDGTTYECELRARRVARVDEWIGQLDHVLDRYLTG